MNLRTWALKHGVPFAALAELEADVLGLLGTPGLVAEGKTESFSQSQIREEAPRHGVLLFRNNVGVLTDETGRPVRYGLANDTPAMNKKVKSCDLIGVRKVLITAPMVGSTIGQICAREAKAPGWQYTGADREEAQLAFINLINAWGGDAKFATGPGSF